MMKLNIGFPGKDEHRRLADRFLTGELTKESLPVATSEDVVLMKKEVKEVICKEELVDYALSIIEVKEKVSGYDPATAVPPSDVETQKKKAGVSDDMGDENPETLSVKDTVLGVIKKAGGYLSGLMGMALLLLLIYRLIEIISYNRLSPYDKVISDIGVISRKCDKRLDGETKVLSVFDYIPYIKQKKTEYDLNEVFGEYYRIRYRGDEPDMEFVVRLHKLAKNA